MTTADGGRGSARQIACACLHAFSTPFCGFAAVLAKQGSILVSECTSIPVLYRALSRALSLSRSLSCSLSRSLSLSLILTNTHFLFACLTVCVLVSVCVYMCVCVCVYMFVCMFVCTCMCVCVFVSVSLCVSLTRSLALCLSLPLARWFACSICLACSHMSLVGVSAPGGTKGTFQKKKINSWQPRVDALVRKCSSPTLSPTT